MKVLHILVIFWVLLGLEGRLVSMGGNSLEKEERPIKVPTVMDAAILGKTLAYREENDILALKELESVGAAREGTDVTRLFLVRLSGRSSVSSMPQCKYVAWDVVWGESVWEVGPMAWGLDDAACLQLVRETLIHRRVSRDKVQMTEEVARREIHLIGSVLAEDEQQSLYDYAAPLGLDKEDIGRFSVGNTQKERRCGKKKVIDWRKTPNLEREISAVHLNEEARHSGSFSPLNDGEL